MTILLPSAYICQEEIPASKKASRRRNLDSEERFLHKAFGNNCTNFHILRARQSLTPPPVMLTIWTNDVSENGDERV
jgi:hypothetical protein